MSLKTYYQQKSAPLLKKELKIENALRLPRLEKVVVSLGLSEARFDEKETQECLETLTTICGQKPVACKAKKAISNFKIRQGQIIAYKATLRGQKMYDFIDKLINVALPRIRDFRGIPAYSIDESGNLSLGIKEQIAFPEIKMEKVTKMHGLQITIVTTAKNREEAKALIKSLGGVFLEEKRKKEEADLSSLEQTREKKEKKSGETGQYPKQKP